MQLQFERGSGERPRGHALFYLRSTDDPEAVLATYLIVLPVTVDLSRYLPPMFAQQMPATEAGGISAMPWPPVPEPVSSHGYLERLADSRDDDLISGGAVDPARVELMLQVTAEASQEYARLYSQRELPAEEPASEGPAPELDVDEVLYSLMGERDRLTELVKLTGKLRDAVEAGDRGRVEDAVADVRRLARHFPEKYRLEEFLAVAQLSGAKGRRLTELYVERCYHVCNEDYAGLQQVDAQIQAASSA
jgi:hypothetical protein